MPDPGLGHNEASFDRLPKWAQNRIRVLEMRVAEAAERAAIGPENSNTFADPHAEHRDGSSPVPLGRDAHIRFWIDSERHRYIDVRLQEGVLGVNASEGISVSPQSSNVVNVRLDREA